MSFNQIDYIKEYNKEFTRRFSLIASRIYEKDIIDWLEKQPNKQAYLKALVRKDIEEKRSAPVTVYTVDNCDRIKPSELLDIISSAICGGIGYWGVIDNSAPEWKEPVPECDFEPCISDTFDWHFYCVMCLDGVTICDVEDENERWFLTREKLIEGIRTSLKEGYWDGDLDSIDGSVADSIFQCALFNDIVYG